MRSVPLFSALALLGTTAFSSAAAWQRLPVEEKIPVNLASKAIVGTKLLGSEGINGSAALISGGNAEGAALMAGKDNAVVELVGQHTINEVLFINDSAEGKAIVSTSVDGKKWMSAGQGGFNVADRVVSIRFAIAAARFVRVDFDMAKSGTIRGFGIFGGTSDKDYRLAPGGDSSSSSSVNLAGGAGGTRAIYAWPQPMFSDESELKKNIFRFPKTKEKYRILIYDLGSARTLKEFATSYSERPTRVEVFTFTQLPETPDWKGKPSLDPAIFDQAKPTGVGEDPKGIGHIKVKLEHPVTAQYVALRFEPNYNRHANAGLDESWSAGLASVLTGSSALVDGVQYILPSSRLTAEDSGGVEYEFTIAGVEIGAFPSGGGSWTFEPLFDTGAGPSSGGNANGGRTITADLTPDLSNVINNLLSSHSASGAGNTNPFTAGFTPFTVTPAQVPNFPPPNNGGGGNTTTTPPPTGPTSP